MEKDTILFIAEYPTEDTIKEGMMQRINNIDKIFNGRKRIYLSYSFRKYTKLQKHIIDGNLIIYKLNFFLHLYVWISIILRSKFIYIHSLYNSLPILFLFCTKKKIYIDMHGAVPEELLFYNLKGFSLFYSLIEKIVMRNVSGFIFVSNAMKNYYLKKYPFLDKKECITYPILSKEIFSQNLTDNNEFLAENGINDQDIIFIYSGNLQKWQNFDSIINIIEKSNNQNYKFFILTNDFKNAKLKIDSIKKNRDRIILKSVNPKDLNKFYNISHYGFILRDEHILNKVAAPTKLIEYLYYGLTPIVKYSSIGDFEELGYEYIVYSDFNDKLQKRKSELNSFLIKKLLDENSSSKISDLF